MAVAASTLAAAKLEQFMLLARSAKGASAAKLIERATSAPGCFVFAELLQQPSIRELKHSEEHSSAYRLLELFAYGVHADYASSPYSFPSLSEVQVQKLKLLTLVTECYRSTTLKYDDLLAALDLPDMRALEDLIIEGIYAGIVSGRLDEKSQIFQVEGCLGRDVRGKPELENLVKELERWSNSAESALQLLSERIDQIKQLDASRAEQRRRHDALLSEHLQKAARHIHESNSKGPAASGYSAFFPSQGNEHMMDVGSDDLSAARREKKK
ncbi:hypothetical protein K437DRAFT_244947 [Tilletiaria anomala UBC 951]|uniref:PCI domain-containing protein n=1 Tax=Tilletiaria anomala (strain ATCC 24038 / CBS 436.72 / UBC 951) TaxID=1037660 RepID=A0A066W9K4_TILAU|nr:uncharacterized protein K437DRAFT_244947 [Tilletiaria anomala UBC 951]KDN50391.1 hypothetical protein K437DRAFT_244947 [Tilletiaria anomala UBC 951]